MEKFLVAIIGCNNNTYGLLELLRDNKEFIYNKTGLSINIKYIYADKDSFFGKNEELLSGIRYCDNYKKLLDDKDINIIIETLDNAEKAKHLVLEALDASKNVIISNKELLVKYGRELISKATSSDISLCFESCVGGGIPLVDVIKEDYVADDIYEIHAILSGTANYILTNMENGDHKFSYLLEETEKLGYTEYDSTLDISGVDSAYKIVILSMIAFKGLVDFNNIYREGIEKIRKIDIDFAEQLGCKIKLLAIAKRFEEGYDIRVQPTMIPKKYMLAKVRNEFNAVYIKSDNLGNTIHYGRGAGSNAIGSALASDIVSIIREMKHSKSIRINPLGYYGDSLDNINILDPLAIESKFYIRLIVDDAPGVLAGIAGILGDNNIGISAAIQPEIEETRKITPLVFLTHKTSGYNVKNAVNKINSLDSVKEDVLVIRVED